jgi:hypothetical protein
MWDSQSHKGRPIFGGWHKSSPMVVVALGLLGLPHLSNSKWKKLGTQSLGGDPWDGMAISGRGCWSRHTKSHLMASFWSRAHLCGRPKQRRNEASEFSTNENTSWTTKWGFPKIGVPLFYHPFDRFSMK